MMKYIKIYDIIGFKICWALCAFCTVWNQPYLGPLATLLFILIHLFLVKFKNRDIKVIIIAILCGLLIDSLFSLFSLIEYKGGLLATYNLSPLWILSMWAGFAITLLYALDSLRKNYFLSAILGFIGGPLSYSAGVSIGSLEIHSNLAYVFLALAWGMVIPCLFKYINSID